MISILPGQKTEFKVGNSMLLGILFHKLGPTTSTDSKRSTFSWLITRFPFSVECFSSTTIAMLFKAKHWIQVPLSCQLSASLIFLYCFQIYCVDKWVVDRIFSLCKNLVKIKKMFGYSYIAYLLSLEATGKLSNKSFASMPTFFCSKLGENGMWYYFNT